jgi:hypothetical protein
MQRFLGFLIIVGLFVAGMPPVTNAQTEPQPAVSVSADDHATHLEWIDNTVGKRSQATIEPDLPLVEIGGLRLPAHLVAVRVAGDDKLMPRVEQVETVPWVGPVRAIETPIPQNDSGEQYPALAEAPDQTLPTAPVVVLRESRLRGERIAVLAVSPIFAQEGTAVRASQVRAILPNAVPLDDSGGSLSLSERFTDTTPFLTDALPTTNGAAARPAARIRVFHGGIQQISGAMLNAAGIDLATLNPAYLHLWHDGVPLPILTFGTEDGRLDSSDVLHFYAPPPGDRWNAADTYWITVESTYGPRMQIRDVLPDNAVLRANAREQGVWRDYRILNESTYESNTPGPDGDHWFSADMRTGPGLPAETLAVTLDPSLPLGAGQTILTLAGNAYTEGPHRLEVQMGTETQVATWQGVGDWVHTLMFTTAPQTALSVVLVPGSAPSEIKFDSLAWDMPVALNTGGQGVTFTGIDDTWRYQLVNVAAGSILYEISNPAAPRRLNALQSGSTMIFEDVANYRPAANAPAEAVVSDVAQPAAAVQNAHTIYLPLISGSFTAPQPHRYLLTGASTLHIPEVTPHTPVDLVTPLNATAVYIAPAGFQAALAPLVALRQSQGHTVAVVDVQAIYDTWGHGQVSPEAIRSFLRHAAATWNPAPVAVTLVGDGSVDPLNYEDKTNTAFIPPYMAMVDNWLGETACDTCYAQLDGTDALADMLPDLLIGRLPVKSATELEQLVAKIVGYETSTDMGAWRSRAVFIADNFIDPYSGQKDPGGDFAQFANESIALQPPGLTIERLYYDPSSSSEGIPWREPDAVRAYERTVGLLNNGAGLVLYAGHNNHWKWARTDFAAEPPHLLGLYDPDNLTNHGRLPIALVMSCLSSAFQKPAVSGTTIDERMVLSPAGAVASWGSTGLGVSYGHDRLQQGFFAALWDGATPDAVGGLTQAGYTELFVHGRCCQSAVRTFVLLGDPLTTARVSAGG